MSALHTDVIEGDILGVEPVTLVNFREGKPATMEHVYRAYSDWIERYVRGLASHSGTDDGSIQPGVISDVVQETFSRAFAPAARRAYDGLRPYRLYLARIARNCFVDIIRSKRREVCVSADELPEESHDPAATGTLADWRVRAVFVSFLGQMHRPLAEVYEQRFGLERTQEQAAEALGRSRGEVRTIEGRLKRGLRRALRMAGIRPHDLGPSC